MAFSTRVQLKSAEKQEIQCSNWLLFFFFFFLKIYTDSEFEAFNTYRNKAGKVVKSSKKELEHSTGKQVNRWQVTVPWLGIKGALLISPSTAHNILKTLRIWRNLCRAGGNAQNRDWIPVTFDLSDVTALKTDIILGWICRRGLRTLQKTIVW